MTYFPVPFFMSSAGYAMHLATTYRTETHFGSERPDAWRVAVNDATLETVVYVHDDPLALARRLHARHRPPDRPGARGCSDRVATSSNGQMAHGRRGVRSSCRSKKVPTTGLDDTVHFLPARSELGREPELAQWIERRSRAGLQGDGLQQPVRLDDDRAGRRATSRTAREHGLFALDARGQARRDVLHLRPVADARDDRSHEARRPSRGSRTSCVARSRSATTAGCTTSASTSAVRGSSATAAPARPCTTSSPCSPRRRLTISSRRRSPTTSSSSFAPATPARSSTSPACGAATRRRRSTRRRGSPSTLRGGLNLGMSGVPLWGSDIDRLQVHHRLPARQGGLPPLGRRSAPSRRS